MERVRGGIVDVVDINVESGRLLYVGCDELRPLLIELLATDAVDDAVGLRGDVPIVVVRVAELCPKRIGRLVGRGFLGEASRVDAHGYDVGAVHRLEAVYFVSGAGAVDARLTREILDEDTSHFRLWRVRNGWLHIDEAVVVVDVMTCREGCCHCREGGAF